MPNWQVPAGYAGRETGAACAPSVHVYVFGRAGEKPIQSKTLGYAFERGRARGGHARFGGLSGSLGLPDDYGIERILNRGTVVRPIIGAGTALVDVYEVQGAGFVQ